MGDLEGYLLIRSGGADNTGAEGEGAAASSSSSSSSRHLKKWRGEKHDKAKNKPEFYFTLRDNVLSYAKVPGEPAVDIILMQNVTSVSPDGTHDVVVAFKGGRSPLVLRAHDPVERNKWLAVLQRKTAAGTATPNRRLTRRIVVDIDDSGGEKEKPKSTAPTGLSLDLGMDQPASMSASGFFGHESSDDEDEAVTSAIAPQQRHTALDVSDAYNDEESFSAMQSCMDFGDKITLPIEVVAQQDYDDPEQSVIGSVVDRDDEVMPPPQEHVGLQHDEADDGTVSQIGSFILPVDGAEVSTVEYSDDAEQAEATERQDEKEQAHDETKQKQEEEAEEIAKEKQQEEEEVKQPEKEKEEETSTVQAGSGDTFSMPQSIEDSMLGGPDVDMTSSFILPQGADTFESVIGPETSTIGAGTSTHDQSFMMSSVSESVYGQESVIVPKQAQEQPLLRQFHQMQERRANQQKEAGKEQDEASQQDSKTPEQETTKEQQATTSTEEEKEEKETPPEFKIVKEHYVDVADPAELRLLLKWGLPNGTSGIFADGILIDLDPNKPPYWSLNPHGRIRIAMTKQETLEQLRERITKAKEEGDTATVEALMRRYEDVSAIEEPPMTCFHFCDDLKLCYRQDEWVVMRKLPPADPDPAEWLREMSQSLNKLFTTAQKSVRDFFGRITAAATKSSDSAAASAPPQETPAAATEQTQAAASAPPAESAAKAEMGAAAKPLAVVDKKKELLDKLEHNVNSILQVLGAAQSSEERADFCNDTKNPRIAVLVRVHLCTSIAHIMLDGFKSERLFGSYHIWDWVASYGSKKVVAATSIAVLGLKQAIATVSALQYDKHASLRAFVCAALNAQMLSAWLDVMTGESDKMAKFFQPGAMLRDPQALAAIRSQLERLAHEPFVLSLDFEARGGLATQKNTRATTQTTSKP